MTLAQKRLLADQLLSEGYIITYNLKAEGIDIIDYSKQNELRKRYNKALRASKETKDNYLEKVRAVNSILETRPQLAPFIDLLAL